MKTASTEVMSIKRRNDLEKCTWKTHKYFADFQSRIHVEIFTSNRCHNFHVDSPFKIDEIPMNFLRVISTSNRWLANKDVPIRFALSNICKRLLSHTQKPGADPGIILECCKILQKKIIAIRYVKSKGFYCKLFWPSFKTGISWHWHGKPN